MLEFLLAALKEHQDLSLHEKLKLMKDTFLTHRQIGESECYFRLLPQLHLSESNLSTTFLHTGFNKSKFLRKVDDDEDQIETVTIEGREGKYVEGSSIHDKYLKRPAELFYMCFAQFAKVYSPVYQSKDEDKEEDSEDVNSEHFEKEETVPSGNEVLINSIESDFIIHPEIEKRKPLKQNIKLVGTFYHGEPRYMRLRKKRLAIRYHKFKQINETHEYIL